jgi:hypothetical protein
MGYRSNVTAVFYAENEDSSVLKLFMDENFPNGEDGWLRKHLEWQEGFKYSGYVFDVQDVKWYDDYPDVNAFDVFTEKFKELSEKHNWMYEYIRIGEEVADIEEDSCGDPAWILKVVRDVDIEL